MPKLLDCGLWEGESALYGKREFTSATMACLWAIDAANPIFLTPIDLAGITQGVSDQDI